MNESKSQMKKREKNHAINCKDAILGAHEILEENRADDDKLWAALWHATIPKNFLVVASHERFNGTVWSVYAYITTRMHLASGKSHKMFDAEICKALGISEWTLDRAKATLKEYGFLTENTTEGSVYHAQDVEFATEQARLRQIRKQKEERLAKHEKAILEEEKRTGSMPMRRRMEFIKEEFNEEYAPVLD